MEMVRKNRRPSGHERWGSRGVVLVNTGWGGLAGASGGHDSDFPEEEEAQGDGGRAAVDEHLGLSVAAGHFSVAVVVSFARFRFVLLSGVLV